DLDDLKVKYRPDYIDKPLQFHKIIEGWNLPDKPDRKFYLALTDHQGHELKKEVIDGIVDFGNVELDPSMTIYVQEDGTDGDGWVLDKNQYPVKMVYVDNQRGQIEWHLDPPVPPFVNRYVPTPATATLHAKKAVNGGKLLEAGQFTFGIFDDKGNLVETGTNEADGNIKFPVMTFDKPGEFNYTIKETTPDGGGYTTDKKEYPYKVVVTDDGKGTLSATVTEPTPEPTFVNTYTTEGSEHILAYKVIKGTQNAPDFKFTLKDKSGNVIKQIESNGGTLDFGVLDYTEPGNYEYTVEEETPLPNGWSTHKTSYRVIVHMTDNGKGELMASVNYPDSDNTAPQFINTYLSVPANVGSIITGTPKKNTTGKAQTDSEFRFGLFDGSGNLRAIGFNNADGTIRFPVFYSDKLGETDYTMKEISTDGNGWTIDKTAYPVKVNITDNGEGQLFAEVTYPDGTPNFNNVFKYKPASENITAKKMFHGENYPDTQFNFSLKDASGNVVKTVQNTGRLIDFGNLKYTEPGTYVYTIEEDSVSAGAGWNTDTTVFPVVVTVTDDGEGNLYSKVSYPGGNIPVFDNYYVIKPVESVGVNICAKKYVCGACLCDEYFTFGLFSDNGEQLAQANNNENGDITFPQINFTSTGIYHFTVKELTPSGNCWQCDNSVFGVTVTVTDNNGLQAEVTYDSGEVPTFTNFYNRFMR
ncbi:MAG: hypothetical protein LBL87_03240, partial [Ruminococcus sp.]|nr:hypothetical protein [Ruminococcus sp.]